ncbi:B1 protein-like isoform X1 [Anticarsia gemmatalis]|uniref:B1 protein-like isoform X1 n=1 Tax=Anticarsia gemmatalis TaxID=129554 RepID=UPI003F7664E4
MQAVLLICCLAVTGIAAHTVQLTQAQKDKATQISAECLKESGVKPEVIAEAKKGHFTDDEGLKKFTLCFFQKAGIVGSDGKLNVETALSKLPPGVDKTEAEKVLEGCKNKTGKDAADTAFEILKCYRAGTKTHIFLGF